MDNREQVHIIVKQLKKIRERSDWSDYQRNKAYFEIFTLILEEATQDERLNFTTLFSRLAFVGTRHQLKGQLLHFCHTFRKAHEQGNIRKDTEHLFVKLGEYVCTSLLSAIFKIDLDKKSLVPDEVLIEHFSAKKENITDFKRVVEAVLFEIDAEKKILHFFDEDEPALEKMASYDLADRNELFTPNIDSIRKSFDLPLHINLIDVDIRDDGMYLPRGIIVQPDHLVDVTSISECFKEYGAEPFLYLISKFKPAEATRSLMTGNLVNIMLDQLISDPEIDFASLIKTLFQSNPLGFALLDDQEVKDELQKLQQHYNNLKTAVLEQFQQYGIERQNIFLEPSFYSRDYGIQGRLDLLHQKENKNIFDIIELKSGKTYRPNVYGINASHYIQTLLYDLMIVSAFRTKIKSSNYILYSKEENPLRFAPPVRVQQYEALKLRNDIIAMEQKLKHSDTDASLLTYIKGENFPRLKGFNVIDINNFNNIYFTLNELEKSYFNHFTAFIGREHGLSKTGEHGINKSNGHAALWLESDEEKTDRFAMLSNLFIIQNDSDQQDAIMVFSRAEAKGALVNFRTGDLGVLYPTSENNFRSVLRNQIFKCTILDLNSEQVIVKLRSSQFNQSLFNNNRYWNIEQDNLDSSFNSMYKNLFTWAAASSEYRNLILGLTEPRMRQQDAPIVFEGNCTENQTSLLNKVLAARDYFLIWGPPGTGKTSVILRNIVAHLHQNTDENIMVLAYTNRAVDEICDAIISIGQDYKNHYLRLGSRVNTNVKYSDNLLDQIVKSMHSRHEILQLLAGKRIFVSTVSSMVNKTELFRLKVFDTVIIDEASQILEPMLAGLLSSFKRFILIGDHKQLPAVVVQDKYKSSITDPKLTNIGITDTRMSLFERLYMQLVKNGWNDAFGILDQQGRMHKTIMEFSDQHFYEGKLKILPGNLRQTQDKFFEQAPEGFEIFQNRKLFINAPEDEDLNWKTNKYEAAFCLQIIKKILMLYEVNGKSFHGDSIGIITPYRAQIALIHKYLEELPKDITHKITVDTVERYQGGARDIIIISFCVNRLSQLQSLISLSQEGVDRKLNVALTRAREQLVLIGNQELLSTDHVYKSLFESCTELKM